MAVGFSGRRTFIGGFLFAVVLIGAWFIWLRPATPRDTPVIIYLVDTLRADRLSLYGYAKATSPGIDALAEESVVFNNAYSPAPWTLPSVASLLTSTFPCEHGLLTERSKLGADWVTLPERLASAGFITKNFYENIFVSKLAGLDRGYESLVHHPLGVRPNEVEDFLSGLGSRPFFLYLHTMEPHKSYSTPPGLISQFGHVGPFKKKEFGEIRWQYNQATAMDWVLKQPIGTTENTRVQKQAMDYFEAIEESINVLYDASVLWADENISNIVDILKEQGIWDRAIFILLSDHGEEIGDHGGWFHDQSVYEELIRVPLIIHFPSNKFAGQRIDTDVSLIDLMPTIFDYLGRSDLCADCRGSSLMGLLDGSKQRQQGELSVNAVRINQKKYYRPWKESRGDVNVGVRQDKWKAIWNDDLQSIELYDLRTDPGEQKDLSGQHAELTRRLGDQIQDWLKVCLSNQKDVDRVGELDEETKQELRSLGYFN